ncbi:MAG: hypothetical protein NT093_03245 [Candidatus Moranbacteria bacterium]|nr:hypothetical protein [Candidatus Moranbacteria bacterium]
MNLKEYIHKLQQKPVHERKRIAAIATAAGFLIILLIWVVSFKEMNKPAETQTDETSASLNDLKTNFQTGKDSIQNMMEQLPSQTGTTGTENGTGNMLPIPSTSPTQNVDNNPAQNNIQNKDSVPQLP